jgi:hypothetical protein
MKVEYVEQAVTVRQGTGGQGGRHYHFQSENSAQALELVRWCRQNLGQRGVDWDFSGSRNISVWIRDSENQLRYVLGWGWSHE